MLALQGDFEAHATALRELGAEARTVRTREELEGLDALVIPGGESTTMTLGVEREGLAEPLREFVRSGKPVLGTCAGLILLDRDHLGLLDVTRPAQRIRASAPLVRGGNRSDWFGLAKGCIHPGALDRVGR